MKRNAVIIVCLLITFVMLFSACGGKAVDNRSLSDFKNAYISAGHSLADEDVPLYQTIGAKDGILFYVENNIVKIYEYADEKTLDKAVKDNAMLSSFAKNGKFLCESSNTELINVFKAVEK